MTKTEEQRDSVIMALRDFFIRNAGIFKVEMAFLYGSWARGLPRGDSDIDVAVVFSGETLSEVELFKRIADLSYVLWRELKKEVNVLNIRSDFRKPMLYYNAVVLGLPIYVKDEGRYFVLRNEAIYHMEDFSIFGLRWQYEVARRNLEAIKHA